jgi:hypothetical protein
MGKTGKPWRISPYYLNISTLIDIPFNRFMANGVFYILKAMW